jgi:hemerythrin HHE cation binding domain-containing protein
LSYLEVLLSASRALQSRLDDFRQALDRRDLEAYRFALDDFHRNLVRWTRAEEDALLPAIRRAALSGRDPERELRLQWVQVRELTRYLLEQVNTGAPIGDVLGFAENLARRFAAHVSEMENIYYPAAATALSDEEWSTLKEAEPAP